MTVDYIQPAGNGKSGTEDIGIQANVSIAEVTAAREQSSQGSIPNMQESVENT